MIDAATTPPLGKILTAVEVARFVARVAYPASPVVLVDEELALAAPAWAYGDWRGALGLPDLAEKARTLLPEPTAAPRPTPPLISGPAGSDHPGSVPGLPAPGGERVRG